ncbi:MAG TPA: hypothetical protein VGS27_25005 [Candidatus Sulfotelmatobacter sp.]|nr:hypothetical protein [Candidatus Sulfotelmatobacter sp.]
MIGHAIRIGWLILTCAFESITVCAQVNARLHTSDTDLVLEANSNAPRLLNLGVSGEAPWNNKASETLVPFAEIAGKQISCSWKLNP